MQVRSGPATVNHRRRGGSQDISRRWSRPPGASGPPTRARHPQEARSPMRDGSNDPDFSASFRHLPVHGRRRLRRPAPRAHAHRVRPRSAACSSAARRAPRSRPWCAARRRAAASVGRGRLPLLLRPRRPDDDPRPAPTAPHDRAGGVPTRAGPVVELPVGATEDRVVGSLDLERALTRGEIGLRAGAAGRRAPRPALRRRGQPAARPPGRPAARRRRDGPHTSSATASRSRTPRASCWSAR